MTQNNTQANPGTLTVGQTLNTTSGTPGTGAYFAVNLTAGTTYDFNATGLAPNSDEIVDATEESFAGLPVPGSVNSTSSSEIENFTADKSGVYYVSIYNNDAQNRAFTLSATVVPNSYTLANPVTLTVGQTIKASMESAADTDWFEINLQAGQTYNFVANGLGSGVFFGIQTLATASDSQNAVQAGTAASGITGYNFTADTSGTYAISVFAPSGASNLAYTFAATQVTDSYTLANPGVLQVGGSVSAKVESQNDANWFSITLAAGQTYTFTEIGLPPYATLAVYSAADARDTPWYFEPASNSPIGAATTTFTATTGGTYDVLVRDEVDNSTPSYTLSAGVASDASGGTTPPSSGSASGSGTFNFSPNQETITISSPSQAPTAFIGDGNVDTIAVTTGNAPTTPVDLSNATIQGVTAITDNDTTFAKGRYGVVLNTTQMSNIQDFNGSFEVVGDPGSNGYFYDNYGNASNFGTSAFTLAGNVSYFGIYPGTGKSVTIWMADTNQVVSVGDFDNTVYGGAGNDVDFLGAGLNRFYGGTGNDTIVLFAEDVTSSPHFPAGQVFDGGSGQNEILLCTGDKTPVGYSVDFTGDTLTNIQTLVAWERTASAIATATISAAQFAEITNYSGDIVVAGVTNVSLAGKSSVGPGTATDTIAPVNPYTSGAVFVATAGQTIDASKAVVSANGPGWILQASATGNSTLIASAGNDTLDAYATGATLDGGAGTDTFNLTMNDAAGATTAVTDTITGTSAHNALTLSGNSASDTIDLTGAHLTGVQALILETNATVKLTTEQLAAFTDGINGIANTALGNIPQLTTFAITDAGTVSPMAYGNAGAALTFALSDNGNTLDLRNFGGSVSKIIGGAGTDVIYLAAQNAANTIIQTGSGTTTIYAGAYPVTVTGGKGQTTYVASGNEAASTITESASGVALFGPSGSVAQLNGVQTIQFADGSVNLSATTVALNGGNNTLLANAGQTFALSGTASNWDSVTGSGATFNLSSAQAALIGSGNTIAFTGGTGNAVGLYDTAGTWDQVSAVSGDTVYLTNAQAAVTGGGAAISFAGGAGNVVGLYNTGGTWDSVYAPGGDLVYLTSAQAAVAGGGNNISFAGGTGNVVGLYNTGGAWDSIYAPSGGTIYLTSAQAAVAGGGDTISFAGGSGNIVGLYNTGGTWDSVWAPGGETIYMTSAQAAITGGGNAISFAGGSGNVAGLYATGGTADTVWAPGGETVDLTSAQAVITGGGDTIGFSGGSGNVATLQGTNGTWDTVWGSGGTIDLVSAQATIMNSGNTANLSGNSSIGLDAGNQTLAFSPGIGGQDTVIGFGSGDVIQLGASTFQNYSYLLNSGDLTQQGSDTVITLDANDTIRLTGVTASSLTSANFHFV